MKFFIFALILLCACSGSTNVEQKQPLTIEWKKSFGGSNDDLANSIQQTSDGGYIVAGSSLSKDGDVTGNHGDYDAWILKISNSGSIEWRVCLGGSISECASAIQQTSDNGYIIAGYTNSNDGDIAPWQLHGSYDCWIVKLGNDGTIQWQKSLGGSGIDLANSIQQTSDGGYIVAGQSDSNDGDVTENKSKNGMLDFDYWIVKLTPNGEIQWQKSLGGSGADIARSIQQTSDGGYIVAGSSNSHDGDVTGHHSGEDYTDPDYWVVKLSANGTIEWQKSLGGSFGDYATSVLQTSDGGYIVAGSSNSHDGDVTGHRGFFDYWVVKLTPNGSIDWQKIYGGSNMDYASSMIQTAEGGFIIAGITQSTDYDITGHKSADGPYVNTWLVKISKLGYLEWEQSISGASDRVSINKTKDGGYVLSGINGSGGRGYDYCVIKLKR